MYARVGRSEVHGVGLIAIRDIPKGTNPFKNTYEPDAFEFTDDELHNVPAPVKKMIDAYFGREEKFVIIPMTALNPLDLLHFINHSDTANVETIDGGMTFIAKRDISEGEELTSNYAEYDYDYKRHFRL